MVRKQIDNRTKTMSLVALTCRTFGHAYVEAKVPRARELELKQVGQYEIRMVCSRGCSRHRECLFDLATDEPIGESGGYYNADEYLVQAHGTGRLPRAAARGAYVQQRARPTRTE